MSNRFLRVRAGRRIFRRRIPLDLIDRFGGQRELVQSLGSLPHDQAIQKARALAVTSDELFSQMRTNRDLTAADAIRIVQEWVADTVADGERSLGSVKKTREEALARIESNKGTVEKIRLALASNDTSMADALAYRLLDQHGIVADPSSEVGQTFRRLVLRGAVAAAETLGARAAGDFGFAPADEAFRSVAASSGKQAPKLTEAWARFSAERIKASAWRPSMAHDAEQALALFSESAGDRRLDRYARQDVSAFVAMLQALPAHRSKKPAFKGKTLADLVAMTKADPSLETLAAKTVKKYANLVSSFFGWAVAQGFVTENIASAVYKAPKRTVRRNAERDAWSAEQLRTLFSSPIYAGSKSTARRSEPGAFIVRDADWWLPVLGLFHPCRLEELAQLRVEDVKEEDGTMFFDIRADDTDDDDGKAPGRRLKSLAAVRKVPVHHVALELRFKEYVAERRRKGDVMLWPELEPGGIARRYGFAYSKRFGRYRKAVGLDGVDFHAFRHNAITALVRAKVHPDIISALSGHEVPGERGRYSKGADLPDLKAAIDSIQYAGIDAALIAKR
ncbi:phage integrase family protein [Azospirillum brasilense]|nr:phage integrase family protein [Azospirillum brasilense]